jgi:hypothetical protein
MEAVSFRVRKPERSSQKAPAPGVRNALVFRWAIFLFTLFLHQCGSKESSAKVTGRAALVKMDVQLAGLPPVKKAAIKLTSYSFSINGCRFYKNDKEIKVTSVAKEHNFNLYEGDEGCEVFLGSFEYDAGAGVELFTPESVSSFSGQGDNRAAFIGKTTGIRIFATLGVRLSKTLAHQESIVFQLTPEVGAIAKFPFLSQTDFVSMGEAAPAVQITLLVDRGHASAGTQLVEFWAECEETLKFGMCLSQNILEYQIKTVPKLPPGQTVVSIAAHMGDSGILTLFPSNFANNGLRVSATVPTTFEQGIEKQFGIIIQYKNSFRYFVLSSLNAANIKAR